MVMRQGDGPQLTGLPTQRPRVQKDEARGTSTMQLRHFSAQSIQADGITCYKSEYHPPPPPHHHLEESRTSTQRKGVAKSSPATDTPNSTAERRNWIRRPHSSCRLDFRCGGDREGAIKLVSFSRAIHVSQCMGPSVFGLARLFSGVVPSLFHAFSLDYLRGSITHKTPEPVAPAHSRVQGSPLLIVAVQVSIVRQRVRLYVNYLYACVCVYNVWARVW